MAKKKSTTKPAKKPAKKTAAKKTTSKKLARLQVPPIEGALIMLVAFLELADDEEVDPDSAIGAMEALGAALRGCSSADRQRLQAAIAALTQEELAEAEPRTDLLEFYENFFENFVLNE